LTPDNPPGERSERHVVAQDERTALTVAKALHFGLVFVGIPLMVKIVELAGAGAGVGAFAIFWLAGVVETVALDRSKGMVRETTLSTRFA
jgi:hypothetical protein